MVNAYAGSMLWVDLSMGRITVRATKDFIQYALGGRGINTWILLNSLDSSVSPLDPENLLILGAGPLVGTTCPGAARLSIDAKSPITGGIGSSSCGGYFASELKYAGFDHVMILGRASQPSLLRIEGGHVIIEPATKLWGKTTWETASAIAHASGKPYEVLSIGPAGEKLVPGSCIVTRNGRAAGRCGLGAVMGSKNLKAVAVRGSGGISVASPSEFKAVVREARTCLAASPGAQEVRRFGTYSHPEIHNKLGFMPVRYFEDERWSPEKIERVHPQVLKKRYEARRLSCSACPFFCSHVYTIPDGPYKGFECEGIKANTQKNFGARLDIDDPAAIIYLHGLCNALGLDEDFASCVIGWAFACFNKGLIDKKNTLGLDLTWGDSSVVVRLVEEIASRSGFGAVLANGTRVASRQLGSETESLAVRIKGQESMESMRAAKGWALGCAVSTRGGTHTRGANLMEFLNVPDSVAKEIWGVNSVPNGSSYVNKAALVVYYERMHAVLDSLGVCFYVSNWIAPDMLGPDALSALYSAAVGKPISGSDLLEFGERLHLLEKLFNIKHVAWTRQDDMPPVRFMTEPIQTGPARGELIDREAFQTMLNEYYELHNWDKDRGWPTKEALATADLTEFSSLTS